jgi:hypothetical protein
MLDEEPVGPDETLVVHPPLEVATGNEVVLGT